MEEPNQLYREPDYRTLIDRLGNNQTPSAHNPDSLGNVTLESEIEPEINSDSGIVLPRLLAYFTTISSLIGGCGYMVRGLQLESQNYQKAMEDIFIGVSISIISGAVLSLTIISGTKSQKK